MKHTRAELDGHGLRMPRSRGMVTGALLVLLGAWGALIPFVGPHFNFAYTPDQAWTWTAARGWLEVLPGATTAVGGLLLLVSGNRATAMFGGWLAVVAGAWFVVGGAFSTVLGIGDVGSPVASTEAKRALIEITYFSGLGALIVFLGGVALARLLVRRVRAVQPAVAAEPWSAPETPPHGVPAATAETQARSAHPAAAEPEPRRPIGHGLFRRHHASAGRR